MNRSILYIFHKQPKFERFSFFDSGKEIPYFNVEKETAEITQQINKSFKPWLSVLESMPEVSVSCVVSGHVIQLILSDKKLTNRFKKLIDSEQIELLLSPGYDSLSSIISKDLFLKELMEQKKVLEEITGSVPPGILNTATIYSNDLADILVELGSTYAVAPRLLWYLPKSGETSSFFKSTNKKLNLALAGAVSEEENVAGEIVLIDGFSVEALTSLKKAKLSLLSIAKAMEEVSASDVYSLPDLVAKGVGNSAKLEDYLGNSLQKDFLDRLKKLSSSIQKPGNINYLKDYLWIASADHFLKISKKEVPAQRYTNFVVLQNMLYDLELKLR